MTWLSQHWAELQLALVFALLVGVLAAFAWERVSPDLVALSAFALLVATGILSAGDALGVFSNPAPITIAAMFVLSAALERTGVIDGIGRLVLRWAQASPRTALGALMVGVMVMSGLINNTPVVVILTPVVIGLARSLGQAPSRLLIPLSFASILGGTTTLIGTSTNLLVDGVAQAHALAPFGMFEITGLGAIVAVIGLVYLALFGRRLLPDRDTLTSLLSDGRERQFLAEALVPFGSSLIGKKVKSAGFTEERGYRVIDLIRGNVSLRADLDSVEIEAGDRLVVRSRMRDVLTLREAGDVSLGQDGHHAIEPIAVRETVLMEGLVGPQSRLVGRRVGDLRFRRLYGAYVLAVHRQGENLEDQFPDVSLQVGDSLLIEGPPDAMRQLFDYRELMSLSEPSERPVRRDKAPLALLAIGLVMALAAIEILPIAALALVAAVAVVAFGCLDLDEAYRSIRWDILMLIFGMLALGLAMEKTGAAALLVRQFSGAILGFGPGAALSGLFLLTAVLTAMVSNNATGILMTPIAIGMAQALGVDARPFVVAVMFAASASFATPIGYQTNTFVYGAGGYKFMDFVKIGVPLNLIVWIACSLLIPLFWPF